jgi:bacterioferritin (cytochrome b1)
MVDNQHQKIKGYRDLTEEEIGYMNSVKLHAESIGQQITALEELPNVDKRWLAIAKTDLQKGFMSLVRSIAQPTTF